jgi:acyl-CoA thioester hydrolase
MSEPFSIELEVRDHECDMQAHVNNSVYQNYLEHARHVFLRQQGIDFAAWAARDIALVVTHIEIDYRAPLKSGDRFRVSAAWRRSSRLRIEFEQRIERLSDGAESVRARVVGTAIDGRGRPCLPDELVQLLPVS